MSKIHVNCPYCKAKLKINIEIETCDDKYQLNEIWNKFLVWNLVGKPKYRDEQYWYDDYHCRCKFEPGKKPGDGIAYFAIQVYDSPDKDIWMHAKVPVENGRLMIDKADYRYSGSCFYDWENDKK